MSYSVLTFAVQLGSGGLSVARSLSDRLRYDYFDREVILRAAYDVGVSPATVADSERWHSLSERVLETMLQSALMPSGMTAPITYELPDLRMTSVDYRKLIEQVMKELSHRGGCIIVGHAGQVLLKRDESVFKVLIRGSAERRSQNLAAQESIALDAAHKLVEESDDRRQEFFLRVYKTNWLDSALYDLVLNTDTVETGGAVDCVADAIGLGP
jgi:uncharacterized protein